jgi:hypothetical protein
MSWVHIALFHKISNCVVTAHALERTAHALEKYFVRAEYIHFALEIDCAQRRFFYDFECLTHSPTQSSMVQCELCRR